MNFKKETWCRRRFYKFWIGISRLVRFQETLLLEEDGLYGDMLRNHYQFFLNYFEMVPGCHEIPKTDKIKLLREHNKVIHMLHHLRKCDRSTLSKDYCHRLLHERYRNSLPQDVDAIAEATMDLVKKLDDLELCEEEYAILITNVLFTGELCRGLEKRQAVLKVHNYVKRALYANSYQSLDKNRRPRWIIDLKNSLMAIACLFKTAGVVPYLNLNCDLETEEVISMDIDSISLQVKKKLCQLCQVKCARLRPSTSEEVCKNRQLAFSYILGESEEAKRQRYWLLCDVTREDYSQIEKFIQEQFEQYRIPEKDKMRLVEVHFKEMILFQCALKYSSTSPAGRLIERRPADFQSCTVEDHLLDFLERTTNLRLGAFTCEMLLATVLFTACPGLLAPDFVKLIHFGRSKSLRTHALEWAVLPMSELHALLYNLRSLANRMGEPILLEVLPH